MWESGEGTDFHAVEQGAISVTPMRLDLTDEGALADMASWSLRA